MRGLLGEVSRAAREGTMIDMDLQYDPWQFFKIRSKPVSAETHIAYEDYTRMGTQEVGLGIGKRRWIPAFAFNDEQLRAVLLKICQSRVGGHYRETDWQKANAAATDKVLRQSSENLPVHQKCTVDSAQRAVRKAGSYLGMYAAIAFHYWRRGADSLAVAELLDLPPLLVRRFAVRMVEKANELGFKTYAPHWSAGKKKPHKQREARRATIRRRLYGSTKFDETIHCYRCRVARIARGQKWHCEKCAARRREESRLATIRKRWAKRRGCA